MPLPVSAAATAGVVVGSLAALSLAIAWERPATTSTSPAAAFATAWERSETADYVATGTFERRTRPGSPRSGSLRGPYLVAQRWPDRVASTMGAVQATVGGQRWVCAAGPDGRVACAPAGPAPDRRAELERALTELSDRYIGGASPLYRVRHEVGRSGSSCFRLELTVPYPAPPWGQSASVCFAERTGAIVWSKVERGDLVDETTVESVRSVRDGDLTMPPPAS